MSKHTTIKCDVCREPGPWPDGTGGYQSSKVVIALTDRFGQPRRKPIVADICSADCMAELGSRNMTYKPLFRDG